MPIDLYRLRDRLDTAHAKRAQRVRPAPADDQAPPTDDELLAAYSEMTDDDELDDNDRRQNIVSILRAVLAAPTTGRAAETVADSWGEEPDGWASEWARDYRQRFATPSPAGGEWTDAQLLRAFDSMASRSATDKPENVAREMRAVLGAASNAEAADLVAWWGWEESGLAERWAAGYRARFGVGEEFRRRCEQLAAEATEDAFSEIDPVLFARLVLHEYAGGTDPRSTTTETDE